MKATGFCPNCGDRKEIGYRTCLRNIEHGAATLLEAFCLDCGAYINSGLVRYVNEKTRREAETRQQHRLVHNFAEYDTL